VIPADSKNSAVCKKNSSIIGTKIFFFKGNQFENMIKSAVYYPEDGHIVGIHNFVGKALSNENTLSSFDWAHASVVPETVDWQDFTDLANKKVGWRGTIKIDATKEDLVISHMISTPDDKIIGKGLQGNKEFTIESVVDLRQENIIKFQLNYALSPPVVLTGELFIKDIGGWENVGIKNKLGETPEFEIYMEKQLQLKTTPEPIEAPCIDLIDDRKMTSDDIVDLTHRK
jgi:hypothetical protein